MNEQIFLTGVTGCIGHYVLNELKASFPTATLHILVRRPERFKQDFLSWDNVVMHKGDMDDVGQFKAVLAKCDYLIHIATVWGYNLADNLRINKIRTLEMLDALEPTKVKKIIYFSTASILTQNNQLSPAAKTEGTPYVKSKYHGYLALKEHPLADKIVTLFPTVVLGGSEQHPFSHISQGLLDIKKSIRWARLFKVPGSFHFLHGIDIAKMVSISMTHDVPNDVVIGNQEITFTDAFYELAAAVKKVPLFRVILPKWIFKSLTVIFKNRIDSWGRHCLQHPHFNYNTHSPAHFNYSVAYPTLTSVIDDMQLN